MSKSKKQVIVNDVNQDIINHLETLPTTSSKIRYLNSQGWDNSKISKHLGKRYQHVRNVLITPIKNEKK